VSRTSILSIVSATLVALGSAYWIHARDAKRPWPKPGPPPPPSPIYHESKEPAPTVEEIERDAAEHTAKLQWEIEQALAGKDASRREAVFVFLLPELLQVEPQRVVAMVANQKPGDARERLRTEVAKQWVVRDLPAAARWMSTLEDRERRASVKAAINTLMPIDPSEATRLVKEMSAEAESDVKDLLTAR
jgi:hypothetical protein